jgi:hypothetical protein
MPEEISERAGDRHENEARLREARWWQGGLIAALVFLGLATIYNGIAYRRLTRAQQHLVVSLTRQPYRPALGPHEPFYGPGFAGEPYPPFPGPWAYGPGWGWRHEHGQGCHHPEQQKEQHQGGQSSPG